MRRAAFIPILALALALAGCSQISAIAPVGGDHLAEVRFAAIDVLVAQEVAVLTAPACEESSDHAISCTGESVDGETIAVSSPADDPSVLTVTVGSETIYSGSILDVLTTAVSPAS